MTEAWGFKMETRWVLWRNSGNGLARTGLLVVDLVMDIYPTSISVIQVDEVQQK